MHSYSRLGLHYAQASSTPRTCPLGYCLFTHCTVFSVLFLTSKELLSWCCDVLVWTEHTCVFLPVSWCSHLCGFRIEFVWFMENICFWADLICREWTLRTYEWGVIWNFSSSYLWNSILPAVFSNGSFSSPAQQAIRVMRPASKFRVIQPEQ